MSFDSFYAVSGLGEGAGVRFPGHCFSHVFLGVAQFGQSSKVSRLNITEEPIQTTNPLVVLVPGSSPGTQIFHMKIFSQSKDFGKISGTVSKSVRIGMGYAA